MNRSTLFALALFACCGTPSVPSPLVDMSASPDLAPLDPLGTDCNPTPLAENYTCSSGANDYHPRDNMSQNDNWFTCISDDNTYHLIGTTPAASAEVATFQMLSPSLWANATLPAAADFSAARDAYAVANGIGTRVADRQDTHYPLVPGTDKFPCATAGVSAMYPDRCAGPAKLAPIFTDAFQQGTLGVSTHVQAEKLEAAFLWFFYLSSLADTWACTFDALGDCDSQWADATGGQARDAVTGLSAYVAQLGVESKDRIYDGTLAVRCWRDIDQSLPDARDDLYNFASQQLDRALLHGLALVARQRFAQLGCATGQYKEGHFQFLKILITFLDRASRGGASSRAAQADILKAQVAGTADTVDVTASLAALDTLYPACP